MKPIKMFGLAVMAALMAMAFVGASAASASTTALCKAEESPCSAGNTITHVHETSVGVAELLSSPLSINCTVLFLGDARKNAEGKALGQPLIIDGKFSYSGCNNSCTVTEENSPAEIKVLRTGTELADVTFEVLERFSCFFGFINCRYNGTGLEGHGLGPLTSSSTNGSVVIEEKEKHIESGGCPAETFLDLTTTPLGTSYISS